MNLAFGVWEGATRLFVQKKMALLRTKDTLVDSETELDPGSRIMEDTLLATLARKEKHYEDKIAKIIARGQVLALCNAFALIPAIALLSSIFPDQNVYVGIVLAFSMWLLFPFFGALYRIWCVLHEWEEYIERVKNIYRDTLQDKSAEIVSPFE